MEFIFELFAELLGRTDESLSEVTPAAKEEAEESVMATEVQPEAQLQDVNIFNVVNFH